MKKKVVLGNIKHSGDEKDISLNKSEPSKNVFSNVNSLSGDEKVSIITSINVGSLLNSAANTSKTKCVNTGVAFGSLFGSPNFNINNKKKVSLLFYLSISLDKKWVDLKIVKTQIKVSVRQSFALNINLLAVEGKLVIAKTQIIRKIFSTINEKSMKMAVSLARKKRININSNLKRQGIRSDQTMIIKEISMNTLKDIIIAVVSEFGKIRLIKIQLIGMWQKAVMEFAELDQANLLTFKWSFLIALRDQFRTLLFTLPVRTMAHDFGTLLERAGGKTCVINRSLKTGNKIYYAVVGFEFDNDLESVFCMKPILGGIKLSWAKMNLPLRIFKKIAFNECCLQLAKLYKKKSVPIFHSAAFGSKFWAQVVSLAGSSDGLHFASGFGFFFFGTSGLNNGLTSVLQHKIGAVSFSFLPIISDNLITSKEDLVLDIVMDDFELVFSSSFSAFLSVLTLGLSSSKVFTTKIGNLESKLVALETSVSSVLTKLDYLCASLATCNVQDINILAKQKNVIHWYKNMGNLILIFTETKLKDKVHPWIAGKFKGVCMFTSGLNFEYLGTGVIVVMDFFLAKHVCKISEMSSWLLSIRLLFKNKLSVSVLGLYVGALSIVRFLQTGRINSLIAKAANRSSFIIFGGDFNEDSLKRSASFKKCVNLGLINSLSVDKTIDFVLVLSNLVSAIVDHNIMDLNSFHRQANKNCWKFDFKDANNAKWGEFKEAMTANTAMLSDGFIISAQFLDLDMMWNTIHKIITLSANKIFRKKWSKSYNSVFTKEFSKFYKLELLVSKIAKAFHEEDIDRASIVQKIVTFSAGFDCMHSALFSLAESLQAEKLQIRSAVNSRIENFATNKSSTIRSVVLNHLVVENELILESNLVKTKIDIIMEGWTRKRNVVGDFFDDWSHQYQPLEYVFDDAFSNVMYLVNFDKLLGVISNLPDGKAVNLSGVLNELWKHCNKLSVLGAWKKAWVLMIPKPYEPIALVETVHKIFFKILLDKISLAYSSFDVLCKDNFLVLKSTIMQSPIFVIGSIIENALKKNHGLWLFINFLDSVVSFPTHFSSVIGTEYLDILESSKFELIYNQLLGLKTDSIFVYTHGSLKSLGSVDIRAGAMVFFEDISLGLEIKVSGLMSFTLAELQAIVLAFECVSPNSLVGVYSDSQVVLDACKSELGIVYSDFRNCCWVEH
ncbi:hypothetical protein G9A89_010759 [Geosiphon pyriformis]|nr:hypothetical protein G9A89_010759 [Geosiphon pyriformis]